MKSHMGPGTLFGAAFVLSIAAAGCDPYGAYCEDRIYCLGGNDADVEACTIDLEAQEDVAELWGCADLWDDYQACREEFSVCDPDRYEYTHQGRCDVERDRYHDCVR